MKKISVIMMIFMMLAGSVQASVWYDSYYEKAQNRTAQKIGAAAIGNRYWIWD